MKQNTTQFKWLSLGIILLAFLFGGQNALNAQYRNKTEEYRAITAWVYDYGQATPIKIKVKDGEVVAYQNIDSVEADTRKRQTENWINIVPSATVVKTSGYEDGNLARKHEYKAKLRVANGFRNNYLTVYL